jgi:predicted AAA+ superfamily ATPase
VGKTWAVLDFAERSFDGRVHVLDFERQPGLRALFAPDRVPSRILDALQVQRNVAVVPGRDLLFLDEVQACPEAIVSLRYFFEEMPDLHVIAAGSLLELALGGLSFPVGRIHPVAMYPMTFVEFLWATGAERAAELVSAGPSYLPEEVHRALLEKVRLYLFVGGMPAAVKAYVETGQSAASFTVQDDLVAAFREDFGKYSVRANKACLDAVLTGAARAVGQPTKYRHLAPGFGDHPIRDAYDLLAAARVLKRVPSASPAGLPLGASASARRFKTLLLDVGLLQRIAGAPPGLDMARDRLLAMYTGALAEQFVGQELVASCGEGVHCWLRPEKSSSAEVDYLVASAGRVVPIEVKSGPEGRLRSLHQLLKECPRCAPGLVLSESPYAELPEQGLTFVPLYFAGELLGRMA